VMCPEAIAELPTRLQTFVDLEKPGHYSFDGWRGTLVVSKVLGQGVAPALLKHVRVQQRSEGLQFQRASDSTLRSVKKEFQSAGVPSWMRKGPVFFAGDLVLFIAGLGVDARAKNVKKRQMGRSLVWLSNGSSLNP
jgi:tRNA(Ile)-lysidine synthase